MPKSAIFFALLSLVLAGALGATVWWLSTHADLRPALGGADHLSVGLPTANQERSAKTIRAVSAVVWDTDAGIILFADNAFERRPIASITKLMTAMVALEHGFDWDRLATIEPEEYVIGGQLLLQRGEEVTMRDLFHASLLGSANNATLALVRSLSMEKQEFVREMNRKAIELNLEQTEFVDVTGLDSSNLSTAYEVARLAEAAFRDYPVIAEATAEKEYTFTVSGSGREHTIKNTNKLISEEDMSLTGSKTGYLDEAQFCLVSRGGIGQNRIAVVLGSPSETDSVQEVKTLLQSEYAR
jgi:serine-type D-Ala-D-Ala endopeptidase (penicillin-binding protein 7)